MRITKNKETNSVNKMQFPNIQAGGTQCNHYALKG